MELTRRPILYWSMGSPPFPTVSQPVIFPPGQRRLAVGFFEQLDEIVGVQDPHPGGDFADRGVALGQAAGGGEGNVISVTHSWAPSPPPV